MESLRIFINFNLDHLDNNWVKAVSDSQFITYNELPESYHIFLESEDMGLLLSESCAVVKSWLSNANTKNCDHEETEILWHSLAALNINTSSLLAVIGYILKHGSQRDACNVFRQSCLIATSLYFILLAVPGSTIFKIFHPNLYQSAIDCLKLSEYLVSIPKKRKTIDIEDISYNEVQTSDYPVLSSSQKDILRTNLNNIIFNFTTMIQSFSFKDHVNSLETSIQRLVEVTKYGTDDSSHTQCTIQKSSRISLSNNAYIALQGLCNNKHGPIEVTVMLIAKYFLPRFLYSHTDSISAYTLTACNASLNFLKILLNEYKANAQIGVTTLIQHIMITCPQRLDARQKQAAILIKLVNICTESLFIEAIKNFILLSHHNKIPYRIFAQDIIRRFLMDSCDSSHHLSRSLKYKVDKILFATVLSRCKDASNMVRGRAMAIIAELTESNNNMDGIILECIFDTSDLDKTFPTCDELQCALKENINPLPSADTIINMFVDRIEDERALVRKSAIHIFKNLILKCPSLMDRIVPLISRRCRDSSLTVRKFAIHVLSQILTKFPHKSFLLDQWIEAVVPQVFDVELKVQEKVLECIQEVVIDKITNVSAYMRDANSSLPWRILNKLIYRKMRKHLSKACNMLVKHSAITKSVITNIQSHIGTDNSIPAWILLAALAQNMKLPNIDKYIVNYEEYIKGNNFQTSIILQVLKYSWSSLDKTDLTNLYSYLYKCLCDFEIDLALISICLDIANKIVCYLHPNNGKEILELNMLHLMDLSETELAKILENQNQMPETISYLKAMSMLGNATFFCTARISSCTLRLLEGLLLECTSLTNVAQEMKELQPAAVILLGQQALRDREIAQEVIPIFGRLIRQEINPNSEIEAAIKINAAKALADLCVRFPALVEPYLSDMCISMKDANTTIREAVVTIFIQLLLEDYIKMKGPFFFHILTMLSDPDEIIRDLTVFLIEERLLTKNKSLIYQQFLESMYHYNDYQHQHKFYGRQMREKEKKVLILPGVANQNKRRVIYDFMLEHLDPAGKIKLLDKLTSQILNGSYNGTINIAAEAGTCLLRDALYILSNDRLQPTSSLNKQAEDTLEQEEYTLQANMPTNNALNVIIEGMRKHGLDILMPILIKLKHKFAPSNPSLENDVRVLLFKIYSEYNKDQLMNLLSEHPDLEKEMDDYRRKLVHTTRRDEDNSSEEDDTSAIMKCQENTQHNWPHSIDCNLEPVVILHRLSSSTYSQLQNGKHLSRTSNSSKLLNNSPYRRQNSIASSESTFYGNCLSEPMPSTSTPKSCRENNGKSKSILRAKRLNYCFQ